MALLLWALLALDSKIRLFQNRQLPFPTWHLEVGKMKLNPQVDRVQVSPTASQLSPSQSCPSPLHLLARLPLHQTMEKATTTWSFLILLERLVRTHLVCSACLCLFGCWCKACIVFRFVMIPFLFHFRLFLFFCLHLVCNSSVGLRFPSATSAHAVSLSADLNLSGNLSCFPILLAASCISSCIQL